MENKNIKEITGTGLNRKWLVWTIVILVFIITILSDAISLSDNKYDTLCFFAGTIVMSIIGSKSFDNKQRKDIKVKQIEQKEMKEEMKGE